MPQEGSLDPRPPSREREAGLVSQGQPQSTPSGGEACNVLSTESGAAAGGDLRI